MLKTFVKGVKRAHSQSEMYSTIATDWASRLPRSLSEGNEVLVSEESVQASVGLASLSHEAGEGQNALSASGLSILVNLKARTNN